VRGATHVNRRALFILKVCPLQLRLQSTKFMLDIQSRNLFADFLHRRRTDLAHDSGTGGTLVSTIAEYARRSGARAARVCEIQVTIGGLLPPSWHGGSSAHILVLPNQPKPASQPGCSIQNSCMHDRSERSSMILAAWPISSSCCLHALLPGTAMQVVRSVQLSQIRRSVKSIDQSNPSTLATYSRSAFHATMGTDEEVGFAMDAKL